MEGTGEKELLLHKEIFAINVPQLQPSRTTSSHSPRRWYRQGILSMSPHCWRGRAIRRCPVGFQCSSLGDHLSHGESTAWWASAVCDPGFKPKKQQKTKKQFGPQKLKLARSSIAGFRVKDVTNPYRPGGPPSRIGYNKWIVKSTPNVVTHRAASKLTTNFPSSLYHALSNAFERSKLMIHDGMFAANVFCKYKFAASFIFLVFENRVVFLVVNILRYPPSNPTWSRQTFCTANASLH